MPRTEAQIRAERARNERVVTITIRLSPTQAASLDKARGDMSRMAYCKRAVVRAVAKDS